MMIHARNRMRKMRTPVPSHASHRSALRRFSRMASQNPDQVDESLRIGKRTTFVSGATATVSATAAVSGRAAVVSCGTKSCKKGSARTITGGEDIQKNRQQKRRAEDRFSSALGR